MQVYDELERYGRETPGERLRWAAHAQLVRLARQGAGARPGMRRTLAALLRSLAARLDDCTAEPCQQTGMAGLAGSHG